METVRQSPLLPQDSTPSATETVRRAHVEVGTDGTFRVVEASGELCFRWVPWEEPDDLPLDRGGFLDHADATAFALGICWERAYHGLLPESTDDVDREREALDRIRSGRAPTKTEPETILARFQDRMRRWGCPTSLDDFASRMLRRMEPKPESEPEISYRRRSA